MKLIVKICASKHILKTETTYIQYKYMKNKAKGTVKKEVKKSLKNITELKRCIWLLILESAKFRGYFTKAGDFCHS